MTPFVGRERELELLLDGFQRSKEGRGQAVSIMAEAGVGKSRLLYEFRKAIANEDVTFLEGRCLSYSRNVAYHPLIDTLKSNFDIREGDGDSEIREKVKRGLKVVGVDEASALPYLLELLSVKDSGIDKIPMSPEARKDRIIEALNRNVLKGSDIRPVVMAIEDLHWIDKSSEDYLKNLLDSISGARVFLIFTYRPEFVHTWGGRSYHSQVNLNRLSNRETLAMVAHLLGAEDIGRDLGELILEKAEGVPFFIEEFTKSLRELKLIEKSGRRYHLVRGIKDAIVPSTVQDVIMARIDLLPEGAKSLLQKGSVAGRDFSQDLIATVTGLSEQELLSQLSILKDSELLYERGIYPQSTYIFKHALTQEVAYNSLLHKRRKEIHEAIARAIEQLYHQRLEEFCEVLANHYYKSDESKKAYQYFKLSGHKAMKNYSNWEAFHFYKEANQVLKKEPEIVENLKRRLEILQLILGPMRLLGYPEDSSQLLGEGEDLANKVGEEKSLTHFYSTIGHYNLAKGDSQRALEYLEKSYQEALKAQDIELMIKTGWYLSSYNYTNGRFVKLIELAQEVIALIEKTRNEHESFDLGVNLYAGLHGFKGCGQGWLGNFEEGKALLEKGLDFASTINDRACMGLLEWFYGFFSIVKGDWKSAIVHLQNGDRYLEETKYIMLLGSTWMKLGWGYCFMGDLERAKKCSEKGFEIQNNAGLTYWLALGSLIFGMIHLDSGDFKNAQDCIREAVRSSQIDNEKHVEGISRIWLGKAMNKADSSQRDEGQDSILQGIKILDSLGIDPFVAQGYLFLGELYSDTGQKERALENLQRADTMFQRMSMDFWLAKTYAVYADLYKKEGDQSKAKEQLEKAIGILRDLSADGWVDKYEKELAAIS